MPVQTLGQSPVRGDADRLAAGSLGDQLRLLVPIGLAQAQPVQLASGFAKTIEVLKCALGVAVLPRIDADLLAPFQKSHDAFRRMPGGLVLAQELVEMRMAINGVAAHDQARDLMRAELDGWQGRCSTLAFPSGGICQAGQSHDPCRLLQEVAATRRARCNLLASIFVRIHDRTSDRSNVPGTRYLFEAGCTTAARTTEPVGPVV